MSASPPPMSINDQRSWHAGMPSILVRMVPHPLHLHIPLLCPFSVHMPKRVSRGPYVSDAYSLLILELRSEETFCQLWDKEGVLTIDGKSFGSATRAANAVLFSLQKKTTTLLPFALAQFLPAARKEGRKRYALFVLSRSCACRCEGTPSRTGSREQVRGREDDVMCEYKGACCRSPVTARRLN